MRIPDSLGAIDWNEMFRRELAASPFRPKSAEEWDGRAPAMAGRWSPESDYVRTFIRRLDLEDCSSLLDVGCGTGDLLLALAPRLERLQGVDFSPAMLAEAKKKIDAAGARNIRLHRLSWTDDWSTLPAADVVTASRSFSVTDARRALARLDRHARRRVCLTYGAGGSFLDESILDAIGRKEGNRPDHLLLLLILRDMGIRATVDFIDGPPRRTICASPEELIRRTEWAVGPLERRERERLARYYEGLPRSEEGPVLTGPPRRWARIGWEK